MARAMNEKSLMRSIPVITYKGYVYNKKGYIYLQGLRVSQETCQAFFVIHSVDGYHITR